MRGRALRPILLAGLMLVGACKDDRCKAEPPTFELELTVAGGAAAVTTIEVEVTSSGLTTSASFDAEPLRASGRATVRVLVGPAGVDGFQVAVKARALDAGKQILARGERSFTGTGDACNFFSLTLGAATDAGPSDARDLGLDFKPDQPLCPADQIWCGGCVPRDDPQHCGSCGNICTGGELCKDGLCERTLSGSLSGLQDFPGKRVVLAGTTRVTPHNGSDNTDSCDAGETGCLRVVAAEIVLADGATIDAAGSGYGGGGGGGGARGLTGDPSAQTCVAGSSGAAGAGTRAGKPGGAASFSATTATGGGGGAGGGAFGGGGGGGATASEDDGARAGTPGAQGGYRAAGANGDSSEDAQVVAGSGGGGGGGGAASMHSWYFSVGGSGGGGAGNAGGGAVILDASTRLVVAGTIRTDGLAAKSGDGSAGSDGKVSCVAGDGCCDRTGSGGNGGSAAASGASQGGAGVAGYFVAGYDKCLDRQCDTNGSKAIVGGEGGSGGAGAGGGLLLRAPELLFTGSVSALGGGGKAANGGTVKLFHKGTPPSTSGIAAHHTVVKAY